MGAVGRGKMPQFTIIPNDIAQATAKLKADFEASNAKFKADLEAISRKPAPSAPEARRAPAPRRARRSPNFRRVAALVLGCVMIVGMAFVAVRSTRTLDRAASGAGTTVADSNAVVTPVPQGTLKRMNGIRDSFTNH